MQFKIITSQYLNNFIEVVKKSPLKTLKSNKEVKVLVDYFDFYTSVSSVYSSKIEGEDIDFDSYFKHKFLKVQFQPNYTRKADDLFAAYQFIDKKTLNLKNVQQAHSILSANLLPKTHRGVLRSNPMFVINSNDRIEYVAASPTSVKFELEKLFWDIELLLKLDLSDFEIFYYAAYIHLVFVKIHPFQDGNGRTARLIEKWFLIAKIGKKAISIQLEKNYFKKRNDYYVNLKKLGLEYEFLSYDTSLGFLVMTALGIKDRE